MGADLKCLFLSLAFSIFQALGTNILTYFLIYGSQAYKSIQDQIQKQSKTLENLKKKDDQKNKQKIKKLEKNIQDLNQELGKKFMFQSYAIRGITFMLNRFVSPYFNGKVLCKIPFEPFAFLCRITHGGLDGNDYTEGGFQFIFWCCSMCVGDIIGKLFIPQSRQVQQLGVFQNPMTKEE